MILDFNKYAGEGTYFLRRLATAMRKPEDRDRAACVLKATMQSLRERLTIEQSLRLMAHLPMFLKAVYVDGWNIKERELPQNPELLLGLWQHLLVTGLHDVVRKEDVAILLSAVLLTLRDHLAEGEWNDVLTLLLEEAGILSAQPQFTS